MPEKQEVRQQGQPDKDYTSFEKAKELAFDAIYGERKSRVVQTAVHVQYGKFISYVKKALDVARGKFSAGASFRIHNANDEYSLSPVFLVKVLNKKINGQVRPYDPAGYEAAQSYGIPVEDIQIESVSVNGRPFPLRMSFGKAIVECGDKDVVVINGDPSLQIDRAPFASLSVIYKGKQYGVSNGKVHIPNYDDSGVFDSADSSIRYSLTKVGGPGKGKTVIEIEDDPTSELSLYDVFFDGDSDSVYFDQNRRETFDMVDSERESGTITIRTDGKNISGYKKVYVNTDLTQLFRQQNALNILTRRPSIWHKPLLTLAFDKDKFGLDDFNPNPVSIRYKVLTDMNRSGTATQRKFVQNALQTPDFMILQGPPGSGKTTAILELIYQLCKEGKRVLLCASTHVAIDNVLEKILSHPAKDDLLAAINPVRVGDANRICSDAVKPFMYDEIKGKINPGYHEIVDSSFNLVCGTVIGVLKYPEIGRAIDNAKNVSLEPMFDVMILDEASKTTFSEFLVPAIVCKKWIVVGDVKQLAPYVEQSDLVPTLLECPALNEPTKRIGLQLLYHLSNNRRKAQTANRAFVLPKTTIEYIDKNVARLQGVPLVACTNSALGRITAISSDDLRAKTPLVVALSADTATFLLEESLAKDAIQYLPPKCEVIDYKTDLRKDPRFISIKFKGGFGESYDDELDEFQKRVEDEIIWRLIRLYELKEDQQSAKNCRSVIEAYTDLLAGDEKESFLESMHLLSDIAIPSIIMMLQEGVDRRESQHISILTHGINEEDMQNRFIMLEYQHRMHPDISRISRKYVYEDKALKDSPYWESHFDYPSKIASRLELRLIDAPANGMQNLNENEANAILKELENFVAFSKSHPRNDGKPYELAVLTFYNRQLISLRNKVQKLFGSKSLYNFFSENLHVTINTVDKFQGQEADVVYLSVVRRRGKGFLDSINRVNVAITRAKEKLIVFGNEPFFQSLGNRELLRQLYQEVK